MMMIGWSRYARHPFNDSAGENSADHENQQDDLQAIVRSPANRSSVVRRAPQRMTHRRDCKRDKGNA